MTESTNDLRTEDRAGEPDGDPDRDLNPDPDLDRNEDPLATTDAGPGDRALRRTGAPALGLASLRTWSQNTPVALITTVALAVCVAPDSASRKTTPLIVPLGCCTKSITDA